MYYKSFEFRQGSAHYNPAPEVEIVSSRDYRTRKHGLTAATYDRFVRLANSGGYGLEILPDSEGVAWRLYRPERA